MSNNPIIQDLSNTISRRAMILGTGKIVLTGALISRMAYLQLWQAPHYQTLSEGNRIKLRFLSPRRGLLLDRRGVILAKNLKTFHLAIIPRYTKNTAEILSSTKDLLQISDQTFERIMQRYKKAPRHLSFIIKSHLSWEEISKFEIIRHTLPGVFIEDGIERDYPYSEHLSHVLGYIQPATASDTTDKNLLKITNLKLGKIGIEKVLDHRLCGKAGYEEEEMDAHNRVVRKLSITPATPGEDIQLTLDQRLQIYAQQRLAEHASASAVVMDIHNGQIICLNSSPGFDPNIFSQPIPHTVWHQLTNNELNPLVNKAIQGEYSPGSIFKLVISLAALETGIITQKTVVHCCGHKKIGNRKFHCWKPHGHGSMDLEQALKNSCDVYYYEIALKLGAAKIVHYARQLGFGELSHIEITGERAGLVPDPTWKRKKLGHAWSIGETANMGIGQGYLLATPLQIALFMARITNGGRNIIPTLIHNAQCSPAALLPFQQENLNFLKLAMSNTVNMPSGTGYRSRITEPNYQHGGKTSTTQVRQITAEERRLGLHRQERPWKWRDHALFAGFAPVHNPRYAISVVVEHGGWGGVAAAPIARDIILKAQQLQDS